jgi:hypothetical protein
MQRQFNGRLKRPKPAVPPASRISSGERLNIAVSSHRIRIDKRAAAHASTTGSRSRRKSERVLVGRDGLAQQNQVVDLDVA